MKIILFTHPKFAAGVSMIRFSEMIYEHLVAGGHQVSIWSPLGVFSRFLEKSKLNKWFGYIDQYLLFPLWVRFKLFFVDKDTLFVFCDQALGPWIPLVKSYPHVVHVHDFTALRSALGDFPLNPVGKLGCIYQKWIRLGFSSAENFISVSNATKDDLEYFLKKKPRLSRVVYNGVNSAFYPMSKCDALKILDSHEIKISDSGFLMHIGGNQWYKNRVGVVQSYLKYVDLSDDPLPLYMLGEVPSDSLREMCDLLPSKGSIRFFSGCDDTAVCAFYSLASLLIFPSFAEGFGWPIIEAMACGCPVITTDRRPMSEVGGDAAFYVPAPPDGLNDRPHWAKLVAVEIQNILSMSAVDRSKRVARGLEHSSSFNHANAMRSYQVIYDQVLNYEAA